MARPNNIDQGGKAYLPSWGDITTAATAVLGSVALGPIGLVVGGIAGRVGHSAVSRAYQATSYVMRCGGGLVISGIKEVFVTAKKKGSSAIFVLVSTIPLWFLQMLQNTTMARYAYAETDKAYLEKCRNISYEDGSSMNLDTLFEPLEGGVSSDAVILDGLGTQASITQKGVTLEQVKQWVALGERLYAALSSDESTRLPDGLIVVKDDQGQEIVVESSVYTARALMWYFAAQAIRGEMAKQSVLLMGHYHPTPAEMQALVKDVMVHGKTLVIPDKENKAFHFLANAKTAYKDNANLMPQDSALVGGKRAVIYEKSTMKMPVLDDGSGYLPAGAKRIAINALLPVKDEKTGRLAIKLEEFTNPNLSGQAAEGHEPAAWHLLQMAMGPAANLAAKVAYLKPEDEIATVPKLGITKALIHNKIKEALDMVDGVDYTPTNKSEAFKKVVEMPLHQVLLYLIHPEASFAKDRELLVLSQIRGYQLIQLKKMIYAALYEGLQAGEHAQFERREEEILLMPHLVGKNASRDYWREQIGKLEKNLMDYLFSDAELNAQDKEANEYYLTKAARFVARANSPTQEMDERRANELKLFQGIYEDLIQPALKASEERQKKAESTTRSLTNKNGNNSAVDDVSYNTPVTEEADVPKVSLIDPNWQLNLQDSYRAPVDTPVESVKIKAEPGWQKSLIEDYVSLVGKRPKDQSRAFENKDDLSEDEYYDAVDEQFDETNDDKPK